MSGTLPDARWGDADAPLPDWRKTATDDDDDPDDELLTETPPDVIAILGFDPMETDDDGETRADALRTRAARPDASTCLRAAGLILRFPAEDGERVLFVRHAERGTWEFPGGCIEEGETPEIAAMRETQEEIGIGSTSYGRLSLLMHNSLTGVDYSTFRAHASAMFTPTLSHELMDWQWALVAQPPEPMHDGVRLAIARLDMHELDLAREIASGAMTSPQQFENIWLFALRITGTGQSYRPELEEYVWRDPSLYLNAEFLARCNGLQVVWEHPPGQQLTQTEFERRTIGAIMLPFLCDDEVWGIAKIYDGHAAAMMLDTPLSTSPSVMFRNPTSNELRRLDDGKTLLIEGEPSLIDHLAICEAGVWDKGGEPTGVAVGDPEMADDVRADAITDPDLHAAIDRFNVAMERLSLRLASRR